MADKNPKDPSVTNTNKENETPKQDPILPQTLTDDKYPTPQEDAAANADSSNLEVGFGHSQLNPETASVSQLERANVDKSDAERIAELPPRKVYNPNAGLRPRVGGPYLDNLELEKAEFQRAIVERREPDYTNMAGTAGVPLVTGKQLANMVAGGDAAVADFIEQNADNEKLGPTPLGEVPFHGTDINVVEASLNEDKDWREFDNTTVTSHDNPDVVFTDK